MWWSPLARRGRKAACLEAVSRLWVVTVVVLAAMFGCRRCRPVSGGGSVTLSSGGATAPARAALYKLSHRIVMLVESGSLVLGTGTHDTKVSGTLAMVTSDAAKTAGNIFTRHRCVICWAWEFCIDLCGTSCFTFRVWP